MFHMRQRKQQKAFFQALGDGDSNHIRSLLVQSPKLANDSEAPLVEASRDGNLPIVDVLLEFGAHPNQRDQQDSG